MYRVRVEGNALFLRRFLQHEVEVFAELVAQVPRAFDSPRHVGDINPCVGLGHPTFTVRYIFSVTRTKVVVFKVDVLPGNVSILVYCFHPSVRHPTKMELALELLTAVVREDRGTGHAFRAYLPQQGRNIIAQQLGQHMLNPSVILGHVIAQNLERVRPNTLPPPYEDGTGENCCCLVIPVLRLHLVLLAKRQSLLEVDDQDDVTWLKRR